MTFNMIYIYDIETYPNYFLVCFKNIKTNTYLYFEIDNIKNESKQLKKFLLSGIKLIGFNNINFDYPLLHKTILRNDKKWTSEDIFTQAGYIISEKYSAIWDNQTKVPQLDLFKIWHYDNKNKSTSLKWLEFAMRWKNVEDLPYPVGAILTDKQKIKVKKYCKNDVDATHEFYKKSLKHISIREFYSRYENLNLMNASETKITKEILSKHLANHMNLTIREVKDMRTYRKHVKIKDVIFDYIKFEDDNNKKVLNKFSDFIKLENNNFEFDVNYKNVKRKFAEGGLHSFGTSGVYESDDDFMIVDIDFASYYPHLSFRNKLHPEHLPEKIFNTLYEGFYNDRKKYPKDDPRNYILKIILNSSYGLSKDKYSFLYDPKWQLAICVNGQLILAMLTERIFKYIKEGIIIFENTDGAAYKIRRNDYHLLEKACREIEKEVNIPLELQECKKIIIRDVNNYINIINDKDIKFKGAYEIDRDYHKNHSKRIVAIAAANYFINGIIPEDTIMSHLKNKKNYIFAINYGIFDFCIGNKSKSNNKLYSREIKGISIIDNPLGKVNRYYVSNNGIELIKKLPALEKNKIPQTEKFKNKFPNQLDIFDIIDDTITIEPKDREFNIEAGRKCTLFNKFKEYNYDIDYDYYIKEAYKLIHFE